VLFVWIGLVYTLFWAFLGFYYACSVISKGFVPAFEERSLTFGFMILPIPGLIYYFLKPYFFMKTRFCFLVLACFLAVSSMIYLFRFQNWQINFVVPLFGLIGAVAFIFVMPIASKYARLSTLNMTEKEFHSRDTTAQQLKAKDLKVINVGLSKRLKNMKAYFTRKVPGSEFNRKN